MGSQFSAKRRAPRQISPPFPSRSWKSILRRRQVNRIDILPDDVLLGIFDFYVEMDPSYNVKCMGDRGMENTGSSRDLLDIWPALPLIVDGDMTRSGTDNVVAALGKSNRVCEVNLVDFAGWQLEQVLAAMQVPFPVLTDLKLSSNGETMPVIHDSFLDGFAPRLRYFQLDRIPFPGLPKLHLSATHLVGLWLTNIPHSGYISPEAIVALISPLSSLDTLSLGFQSPQSRPDHGTRRPSPSRRSVIPALTSLYFKGVIEYLEDLVTGVDTPQLDHLQIKLFNQIDFDTLQLTQFINRTPKLGKRDISVLFNDKIARVELSSGTLMIEILCREPDWQLSSIEQICNPSLHPLSRVEDLYIEHRYRQLVWKNDAIENSLWLQLLLPFTAVNNLYLSKELAPGIAAALQELVGGRITDVLPSLQNIFVGGLEPSGHVQKNIEQFVAARQLSDQPITISDWDGRRQSR